MKISELADHAGVSTSSIRYYERIGLLPTPPRSNNGYRDYDDESLARVAFVTHAKRIGLTLEQISGLLPVWNGVNCPETHDQISKMVESKRLEVLARIEELQAFAEHLGTVHESLQDSSPPAACRPDMSCCMPGENDQQAAIAKVAYLPRLQSRGVPHNRP